MHQTASFVRGALKRLNAVSLPSGSISKSFSSPKELPENVLGKKKTRAPKKKFTTNPQKLHANLRETNPAMR
jgi:hypothetical protein